MKNRVIKLINEGRLEFVNGGWVAPDEACPTYLDLIDNFRIAHEFLYSEFNYTTKIAWQADAFGHSSTMAKLYSEMGYDAYFFGRMNDTMRELMKMTKNMQFIWKPTFEVLDQNFTNKNGGLFT